MATTLSDDRRRQLRDLLDRGFRALAGGHLAEAGEFCRRALQLQPDLVEGHFLVGLVAIEMQDRKTAFSAFSSVTRLQPDHAAAWAQLAKLFVGDGQLNRADAALDQAAAARPSDPLVQDLIATVYSRMGDHRLARTWYEKACAAAPDNAGYLMNLANNDVYTGDIDAAVERYEFVLRLQPTNAQAHWSLAGARKARDHTHIDAMRGILERHDPPPRLQAFLYYAIGKELEDLEDWEAAFEAFAAGARARRETVEYDEAAEVALFDFLEEKFTRDWLDAGAGFETDAPIFVLGQPRTGTTLIERIVGSHPQVHSAGELQQFGLGVRRLSGVRAPQRFSVELLQAALAVHAAELGRIYMESTRRVRGDAPRFIDKLPQNYLYLPLILKALPGAKIIHLTREPMDACFASFKQLFADAYLHSYELGEMARHHCRYRRLMDVWRERFGDRFLDVSYERTVAALEPEARRMIGYLGLDWNDAVLEFHKSRHAVSTASAVQVREPVHSRSVGRWLQYETQLQAMLAVLDEHAIT